MKRIKKILLLLLLASALNYAQRFNSSIIVDGAALFTEIRYGSGSWPIRVENKTYPIKFGLGFYLSEKWNVGKNYDFELRPGLFISDEFFRSVALGLGIRKKFGENYYGAAGLNFHMNNFESSGNNFQPVLFTYSVNLDIGRKISKEVHARISISKPLDNYFGTKTALFTDYGYSNYLNWIVKFGFEWDF